ncbi:glycosyltransferase family 9 protein [Pseudomonadota bacterium]
MKILVIRVGRVGDMLMISPAVKALMDQYPEAEFHMLTSADGQRVFKGFSPRLTTFLLHDRKALLAKMHLKKQLKQVQEAAYDSAFCFELNPTFAPFYQSACDAGHCVDMSRPDAHYSRRCLDVVEKAVEQSLNEYWLYLPVTDEARQKAHGILSEVGINDETFVVGLHPTYSGLKKMAWRRSMDAGRRWPVESFAELAKQLAAHADKHGIDLRIIMDLMPEEADVGEEIVQLSGNKVTMLTPPLDFQRYKATLERMNIFVTTDTGPMHIGGAVGVNLVALFGGTDPNDSGAYVPQSRYQIVQSPTKLIADIQSQSVFDACQQFLPGHD